MSFQPDLLLVLGSNYATDADHVNFSMFHGGTACLFWLFIGRTTSEGLPAIEEKCKFLFVTVSLAPSSMCCKHGKNYRKDHSLED
jgi:hypothetical protein